MRSTGHQDGPDDRTRLRVQRLDVLRAGVCDPDHRAARGDHDILGIRTHDDRLQLVSVLCVDDGEAVGISIDDIEELAVGTHGHLVGAGRRRDGLDQAVRGRVDHGDIAAVHVGDVDPLTVRADLNIMGELPHGDGRDPLMGLHIVDRHVVAARVRDVQITTVRRHGAGMRVQSGEGVMP